MSAHQRGSTTRRATLVCMCLSSNCNTLSNLIPCRGQSATSQAATLFWSLSCPFLLDSRRPAAPLRTEQVPLSLSQALIHKHHLLLHGVNNFYNFSKTEQSPLQQWNVNVGHHAGQLLYERIQKNSRASTSKCRLSAISEMSICQGKDND